MSERSADRRVSPARQPLPVAVARRVALAAARRIRTGCLAVELPDGARHVFGDRASARRAEIRVHDMAALQRILVNGETGAGEGYMDGLWSSPDLVALIELASLNRASLALSAGWWRVPGAGATSRPTTTWATTSTASSSTRR